MDFRNFPIDRSLVVAAVAIALAAFGVGAFFVWAICQ